MDRQNNKTDSQSSANQPAIEKSDLKMNVNENERANENLDTSSFEMDDQGVGSEITDGEDA